MIALSVGIILVLILMGMSVPWCFLCGSLIYVITTGSSTGSFVSTAFYSLESTSTLAIPLFMAAGVLLEKSGIARTLIDLAEKLVGKLKGGMGATIPVVACFFGALSGSGTATVTTLSSMMAPRLRELGWDKRYLAAFIAACGPLGYMIPPNMNAILYANVSSASISGLFLATVIPGLIWAGLYLVINRVTYKKWYDPAKMGHRDSTTDQIIPLTEEELAALQKNEKWSKVLKSAIPAFLMPVIIMGGIYGGIFNATEAGGVGCLYGVIVGVFVYRTLKGKEVFNAFVGTGSSLGSFLIMFPMTLIFSRMEEKRWAYELLNSCGTDTDVDFVMLGCPHYSIDQVERVAQLVDGKKIKDGVNFWVFVPQPIKDLAIRCGYVDVIEKAGGLVMRDCCPALGQFKPKGAKVMATDSGKQAHYLPNFTGIQSWYGSVEECVNAGITGKWEGTL